MPRGAWSGCRCFLSLSLDIWSPRRPKINENLMEKKGPPRYDTPLGVRARKVCATLQGKTTKKRREFLTSKTLLTESLNQLVRLSFILLRRGKCVSRRKRVGQTLHGKQSHTPRQTPGIVPVVFECDKYTGHRRHCRQKKGPETDPSLDTQKKCPNKWHIFPQRGNMT